MNDLVKERITAIPDVCGGRPTIRGMRIMVADILEMLAGRMGVDEILNDYPYLEKMDIEACLHYAVISAKHEQVILKREQVA